MHEPEFENAWEEVPLWKGVLATCLFFFVFVAIPIAVNVLPLVTEVTTKKQFDDTDNLFRPASSDKPRRTPRNTNNLNCPTEAA